MIRIKSFALLIFVSISLNGCTGNYNIIKKRELQEFYEGKKAIVVMQTTPLTNNPAAQGVEMEWLNIYNSKNLRTYRSLYYIGDNKFKIQLYTIEPGHYVLKRLKYLLPNESYDTFYTKNNNINFVIKGGEIVYIGNMIIDLKHNMGHKFFERFFSIKDNYLEAQIYLSEKYPELSSQIQKHIIKFD